MLALIVVGAAAVVQAREALVGLRERFGTDSVHRTRIKENMAARARHFECASLVKVAQQYVRDGESVVEPLEQHCERLKGVVVGRNDVCAALVPEKVPDILDHIANGLPAREICGRLGFARPIGERRVVLRADCVAIANSTLEILKGRKGSGNDPKLFSRIANELCTPEGPADMVRCHNIVRLVKSGLMRDKARTWTAEAMCDDLQARGRLYWRADV